LKLSRLVSDDSLEYEVHGKILSGGAPYDNGFISVVTIENRKIVHWSPELRVLLHFGVRRPPVADRTVHNRCLTGPSIRFRLVNRPQGQVPVLLPELVHECESCHGKIPVSFEKKISFAVDRRLFTSF
jgi:hypothetical protein